MPTIIILSGVAWFTFYSYQKFLGDLAIKQYPELVQHPLLFKTQPAKNSWLVFFTPSGICSGPHPSRKWGERFHLLDQLPNDQVIQLSGILEKG